MQRTLVIAVATAVVAAGIAATATVLLTSDDEEPRVAVLSPAPTLTPGAADAATTSPSAVATASAPATTGGRTGNGATDAPEETTSPTTRPDVQIRAATSVDCGEEPRFCSSRDEMVVIENRLESPAKQASDPKSSSRPTVAMTSEVRDPAENDASPGDEVGSIHVEVLVSNSSDKTFTFAKREIVLEILKGGKVYDTFATNGSGFDMTPGTKMTGTFDRPITEDGSYSWRAKIWYYEKS